MAPLKNDAAAAMVAVAVHLLAFYQEAAELWFMQAESQLEL